jgi:hypothetical protein
MKIIASLTAVTYSTTSADIACELLYKLQDEFENELTIKPNLTDGNVLIYAENQASEIKLHDFMQQNAPFVTKGYTNLLSL